MIPPRAAQQSVALASQGHPISPLAPLHWQERVAGFVQGWGGSRREGGRELDFFLPSLKQSHNGNQEGDGDVSGGDYSWRSSWQEGA